jgi:hypothetical protein
MTRTSIGLFIAVALGCLATGCGSKSPGDQSLVTDIQSKLYADATTKPAGITVAAKDGVVTLSGDVPSSDVELEAMKIANATAGVKSVNDQMKVNAAAGGNPAAPQPQGSYPASPADSAQSSAPAHPGQSPDAPPPSVAMLTIPAGTRVAVRMTDPIDSSKNSPGQEFRASLEEPLTAGDRVAIPAGTPCTVALEQAQEAGRIKGQSDLEVRLTSIDYRGRSHRVNSSVVTEEGKRRGRQTVERTGIGAAAGAVIGALAGGGKGAAIGSAAGGGAGLGYNLLTRGSQVKIPSESVLTFRLEAPLSIGRR